MDVTIPIDAAGRLVLPKAIRDVLRLSAGSRLEVKLHGDVVHLKPCADSGCEVLSKEGRLVVSMGGRGFDAAAAVRAEREERDGSLARVGRGG